MSEKLTPTIGLGVDDVNTRRCLVRMEDLSNRYGYSFQASVLVQNERGIFPDISQFSKKFGVRVKEFFPVLHVSLFTGDFANDPQRFFGKDGQLHSLLHAREYTPIALQGRHFQRDIDDKVHRLLDRNERYVIDQIHRQHDLFKTLFNVDPYGYSYHYGIHWLRRLISLYAQAARERNVPYRFDANRANAPRRYHIAVFDELNYPGITPNKFRSMLAEREKIGGNTEATFHFGQYPYGPDQVRLFEDVGVRKMLGRFVHDIPSEMWRRVEYPTTG